MTGLFRPNSHILSVGVLAPDFTCALSDGTEFTLSALQGRKRLVLVFYPGDNTPVCTAQLCAFRDDWSRFQQHDTLVLGVNPAAQQKHAQFAARHRFPFPILVDAEARVAAAYGCRMLFGLVRRAVYLIDRQGRIAFAEQGNPSPERLLQTLQTLNDTPTSDSDKLSSDKLSSDKLSSDKLSSDKLSSDKLSSDKLSSDKLSSDTDHSSISDPTISDPTIPTVSPRGGQ